MNAYLSDKRQEGESFEEYRARLRLNQKMTKLVTKGVTVWDSSDKSKGTYRKHWSEK